MRSGGGARRCESDRHVLDSSYEVRIKALHRARLIQIRQPLEHLFEHHPQFHPREIRTQAEMFAMAEGEMLVRTTRDLETVGIGELRFIVVGGSVPDDYPVPSL